MQLAYASCGWFFDDVAGLESVLILRHAARVLELLEQVGAPSPRDEFETILARAKSNDPERGNGRDVFRKQAVRAPSSS